VPNVFLLLLPGVDARNAEAGARRDVRAVVGEPAVAVHAAGDERLAHNVRGQQLCFGELELVRHVAPPLAQMRSTPKCILPGIHLSKRSPVT
jgi:hypothetical protein